MVHVYWALPDIWSRDALESAWQVLDSEEEERARRFHFERDRRTFVISHAVVRHALSRHSPGVEPGAWRFVLLAHGRPEIAEPTSSPLIRFSLSHTRGLAACAITRDTDIGLDVENLQRRAPLDVAPHVFAPEELESLRAKPQVEQAKEFFTYWTLKESYAKARGLGLTLPFSQIVFDVSPGAPIQLSLGPRCSDDPTQWRFRSWRIGGEYQAALALHTRDDFDLEEVEVKELAELSCGQ